MSKFKVGDRVYVIAGMDSPVGFACGCTGEVTSFIWPHIKVELDVEVHGGKEWYFREDELDFHNAVTDSGCKISPHYTTDSTGLSGGLNNYYLVDVLRPQREGQQPYTAECEDIIGALDLNFDEGNIFKAIWRAANARKGNGKAGHVPKYDAEKVYHSAGRILKRNSQ